ncbi:hypothetical protein C8R43DRAFT_1136433 [Mycena crocata]|nr:hypothetical protein C8R43DRAFT_1136433 [Mycena crocata]
MSSFAAVDLTPLDTPSPPTLLSAPTQPQDFQYWLHAVPAPRHRRSFAAPTDDDLDFITTFQLPSERLVPTPPPVSKFSSPPVYSKPLQRRHWGHGRLTNPAALSLVQNHTGGFKIQSPAVPSGAQLQTRFNSCIRTTAIQGYDFNTSSTRCRILKTVISPPLVECLDTIAAINDLLLPQHWFCLLSNPASKRRIVGSSTCYPKPRLLAALKALLSN